MRQSVGSIFNPYRDLRSVCRPPHRPWKVLWQGRSGIRRPWPFAPPSPLSDQVPCRDRGLQGPLFHYRKEMGVGAKVIVCKGDLAIGGPRDRGSRLNYKSMERVGLVGSSILGAAGDLAACKGCLEECHHSSLRRMPNSRLDLDSQPAEQSRPIAVPPRQTPAASKPAGWLVRLPTCVVSIMSTHDRSCLGRASSTQLGRRHLQRPAPSDGLCFLVPSAHPSPLAGLRCHGACNTAAVPLLGGLTEHAVAGTP